MTEEKFFITANTENVDLKKRGRKSKQTNYFDVREETAVKIGRAHV